MSSPAVSGRGAVLLCIVAALLLSIVPWPERLQYFRPDWIALTLIYWCIALPRGCGIGTAWLAGLVLDVAHGTLLGQHALALAFVAYLTVRFHLQLRVFPISQMMAIVCALLGLYQFILFWINGVAGVHAPAVAYWGPVVGGTLLWPVLSMLYSGIRYRGPATG